MKLKIAVCDDLKAEQLQLANYIRAYCAAKGIELGLQLYASGEELLERFRPGLFHILFLDIYMDVISGVETARRLRELDQTCAVIFATTSEEHGLVSYEVLASDYLVKPILQEDVDSAMDWCVKQIRSTVRVLTVNTDAGPSQLPLREITYIEIQGHTALIHLDSNRVITARRGLDELEKEIDHPDFLRCHRSFLVNLNFVRALDKASFSMIGGEAVPIGSTILTKVKEQFMNWFFVKTWTKK